MTFRETCCAAAIACLKGTARQKRVAYAYTARGNRKDAAKALKIPLATLKTHLDRIYAANGAGGIADLQAAAQGKLLHRLARENPAIQAQLKELASGLEPLSGTGG